MNLLILAAGLTLVVFGAHLLVEGSVSIAKRYRMPEFLIGITIVGIGTSMPEMVVSLFGSIDGKGGVAIGNIVGSNLSNLLLILGISALIRPIPIEKSVMRVDIPYNLIANIVLLFMCFGGAFMYRNAAGSISRIEGIILLLMFAAYMYYSFTSAKKNAPPAADEKEKLEKRKSVWISALFVCGGLAALIFGGRLFVTGAVNIAHHLGISDSVIAITILAVGTSLPELATSAVAAFKGNTDLALGNIIGSNIANICLILGVCATVNPLSTAGIRPLDVIMPIIATLMLLLSVFTFKGKGINRMDGAIFILVYAAYVWFLIK